MYVCIYSRLDEEKVEKIKKRVALEEKAYRIVVQLIDTTPSENDLSILVCRTTIAPN